MDIIKTWPAHVPAKKVAQIFSESRPPFCRYYFTLGRGKPKQPVERIWFAYQGRILGSLEIEAIVCNDGTLPELRSLSDERSAWQIRKDAWVAVCKPPCKRLKERVFMASFRGWRYFDLESYRGTVDARFRV